MQTATTAVTTATTDVQTATTAVTTQEAVVTQATQEVTTATAAVTSATAAVTAQQTVVTQETNELTAIQNTPVGQAVTYTTSGYVEPTAPATPTVTTTTLPPMGDAATKIQTPFDIKMGDTVFEGQGTNSQIYVSSKATISFGGADWTYWDWPNQTQDGIYVFQSDYMSAGPGASIVVTTTETTLSVDWTLHRYGDSNGPLTYISWDMTVNPETGEWTGTGSMSGNTDVYGGPRTGVRQDNVLTVLPTYTDASKATAVNAQQAVVTQETTTLTTLQTAKTTAETTLTTAQTTLATEKTELTTAQTTLTTAQDTLTTANTNLSTAQTVYNVAITTADTLAKSATEAVAIAVTAVSNTPTQAPQPAPVVIVAPSPQPEPYTPSVPTDAPAPQPEPSTPEVTPGDGTASPETAPETDPSGSQGETNTPEETTPESPQSTEGQGAGENTNPQDSSSQTSTEGSTSQEENQTPSESPSDTSSTETQENATSPESTTQQESVPQNTSTSTDPNQLPDTTPKLPSAADLVPHIQVDKAGVTNGGIEFFGTKTQPQVIGEDGKLTPAPPAPGSGLPIPPDAITIEATFIGQPGGTTFNSPDVATPLELTYVCTTVTKEDGSEVHIDSDGIEHSIEHCTFLPAALDVIPGAGEAIQAIGALYTDLANIGNDMSPTTRKKAKKILVATLVVAAVRRRFN